MTPNRRLVAPEVPSGFTITEILVVVFILAILMRIAVPHYLKVAENGRAGQASATLEMMGAAARMYAVDHQSTHPAGQLTDACNAGACAASADPCDLVRCGYLTVQKWDSAPYNFYALDPASAPGACGLSGMSGSSFIVCAKRKVCGAGVTTACVPATSPYASWGYVVDPSGVFQALPASNGPPFPGS